MLRLLILIVLFVFSVPWYWDPDDARTIFGVPLWVAVSLAVLLVISILTAYWFRPTGKQSDRV